MLWLNYLEVLVSLAIAFSSTPLKVFKTDVNISLNRPGYFGHFFSVDSSKHWTIFHSFLDPKFITNFTVQGKHHHKRQEKDDDKNEGGVDFLVHRTGPLFQATDVFFFI